MTPGTYKKTCKKPKKTVYIIQTLCYNNYRLNKPKNKKLEGCWLMEASVESKLRRVTVVLEELGYEVNYDSVLLFNVRPTDKTQMDPIKSFVRISSQYETFPDYKKITFNVSICKMVGSGHTSIEDNIKIANYLLEVCFAVTRLNAYQIKVTREDIVKAIEKMGESK